MSFISSTAVGSACTPVQRATNDLIRARKVQSDKDYHHNEEVEELDDRAVSSIDDNAQGRGRGQSEQQSSDHHPPQEDSADTASVLESRKPPAGAEHVTKRLDISA